MKVFLFLLIIVASNSAIHAQDIPAVYNKNSPAFFIDNILFKRMPILDANKIDSINIIKDSPNGTIYIKTKKPKENFFITLTQIAKNKGLPKKAFVFMVNGEFLKDTCDVKIDSSYILRTVLIRSTDFKYLNHKNSFTIINIITGNKENEQIIHLRGHETTSVKN